MEGNYGVYLGDSQCGKVQVIRRGLYYRFICRCRLTGEIVCRLRVQMEGKTENLGIPVPMDDGFGLDTQLPVKRFPTKPVRFILVPVQEKTEGTFVPIIPEEPFAYIERLKDAYLTKKNGQAGVMLR